MHGAFTSFFIALRRNQKHSQKVQSNRANVEDVKQYYIEYVQAMGIDQYFRNHCTVTSVQKVMDVCHTIDDESGEQVPCSRDHSNKIKWEVCGFVTSAGEQGQAECSEFCYRCNSVVLATGTFDLPNRLHVVGEHFSYVRHSYMELESAIEASELHSASDPVVVVGAGLSAADAILMALNQKIPVVHIFRRRTDDPGHVLKKLPEAVYPEYWRVYRLMSGELEADGYTPYAQHRVAEFLADGQIVLQHTKHQGCDIILKTSLALVLIGSRPDLSFLRKSGTNLGRVPGKPIDSINNPIDTDLFSFQNEYECGLYAMGPLVGDNFVRFLRGGALGIAADLWKKREGKL